MNWRNRKDTVFIGVLIALLAAVGVLGMYTVQASNAPPMVEYRENASVAFANVEHFSAMMHPSQGRSSLQPQMSEEENPVKFILSSNALEIDETSTMNVLVIGATYGIAGVILDIKINRLISELDPFSCIYCIVPPEQVAQNVWRFSLIDFEQNWEAGDGNLEIPVVNYTAMAYGHARPKLDRVYTEDDFGFEYLTDDYANWWVVLGSAQLPTPTPTPMPISTPVSTATPTPEPLAFVESFTWSGNHAANINGGNGSTVWWSEDNWDSRADTSSNNVYGAGGNGHHVDIHKALSADPKDGTLNNNVYDVGGDGSEGVGIMRVSGEEIVSSRLRTPMLITETEPGVIEFYASNFVTTGHWWEVIIAPVGGNVTPGEFTTVPSTGDPFGANSGSGHRPALDSINMITIGRSDVPCETGWGMKTGFFQTLNGVTEEFEGPLVTVGTDPTEQNELYLWRIVYETDMVTVYVDLDEDGTPEELESYAIDIPWSEVYVYFLAVAYQANHHPQDGACEAYQGVTREFPWRNIEVSPVKYEFTYAFPKNDGLIQIPQDTGWTGYDTRDDQRYGEDAEGIPQANLAAYNIWGSKAMCSSGWWCSGSTLEETLVVDISAPYVSTDVLQFVYEMRGNGGTASITNINGNAVSIALPGYDSVPGHNAETHYVQRSVELDPSVIINGDNEFTITFDNTEGNIALDRMHLEFLFD